ncbi:MAG: flavodoxin family protein [Spirochaetales bacterium]|nr:flavodoxin family protein [Spirochaetales bacterium]
MSEEKKVVIIFAPDDELVQKSAVAIKSTFVNEKFDVVIKEARDAHMPDLAVGNIVILGSKKEDKKPVHSDFTEIIRALKGINLAGRIAGVFTFDSEETTDFLSQALGDSDITLIERGLCFKNGRIDTKVIKDWVHTIIQTYIKKGST